MGTRVNPFQFLEWSSSSSYPCTLAHQNHTIAIASDFRVDGAKLPEIPQKEGVLGSEIAARNRKSLATFHRTLKSQCSIALSCLGNRCDFWGPRWASQSQIAKIAAISVRYAMYTNALKDGCSRSLSITLMFSQTTCVQPRGSSTDRKEKGAVALTMHHSLPAPSAWDQTTGPITHDSVH